MVVVIIVVFKLTVRAVIITSLGVYYLRENCAGEHKLISSSKLEDIRSALPYFRSKELEEYPVLYQEEINCKAPALNFNFVKSEGGTNSPNKCKIWHLRSHKVSLKELMEVFEQFSRIISYSVFFVGFHNIIGSEEMLNLVYNLDKSYLYLLVKLLFGLLQQNRWKV